LRIFIEKSAILLDKVILRVILYIEYKGEFKMIKIALEKMMNECDTLNRPLLPYRVAKEAGVTKGTIFHTEAGDLKVVEYIDWNPATNRRVCAFACEEIKKTNF
jgi:hypothetical protein